MPSNTPALTVEVVRTVTTELADAFQRLLPQLSTTAPRGGWVRGLGAGEALVRTAVAHAKELGVRNVDLTSNPMRGPAHRLYEKSGFAVRDTRVYRRSIA
jgi:hypothetical protein